MTTCQHFPAIGGRAEPRNPAIELFRILAMFGICMIHVSGQGPYRSVWPTNLCCAAVPAFIFISGYFGVRFSVSKLLRLYGFSLCRLRLIAFGDCLQEFFLATQTNIGNVLTKNMIL